MKTVATADLEKHLFRNHLNRLGIYACPEVTIGTYGRERVDYLAYKTNGDFYCYEIKVTLADFKSKHAHTFVGDFGYYVIPHEILDQIRPLVHRDIGIITDKAGVVKRATRNKKPADREILRDSLIRSLAREYQEKVRSEFHNTDAILRRERDEARRQSTKYMDKYYEAERRLSGLRTAISDAGMDPDHLEMSQSVTGPQRADRTRETRRDAR